MDLTDVLQKSVYVSQAIALIVLVVLIVNSTDLGYKWLRKVL